MEILDGILGEHIYLSNTFTKPTCIFYNDKKIVGSKEVDDIVEAASELMSQIGIDDKENLATITALKERVLEIVITKDGIKVYSLKP